VVSNARSLLLLLPSGIRSDPDLGCGFLLVSRAGGAGTEHPVAADPPQRTLDPYHGGEVPRGRPFAGLGRPGFAAAVIAAIVVAIVVLVLVFAL